ARGRVRPGARADGRRTPRGARSHGTEHTLGSERIVGMIAVAIWDSVRQGLGSVLAFFYSIIPNSGVAIILLTVAVRLVLFPLTAKQAKSMIAMQRLQPEIKKLQVKYKNDRQKLNE